MKYLERRSHARRADSGEDVTESAYLLEATARRTAPAPRRSPGPEFGGVRGPDAERRSLAHSVCEKDGRVPGARPHRLMTCDLGQENWQGAVVSGQRSTVCSGTGPQSLLRRWGSGIWLARNLSHRCGAGRWPCWNMWWKRHGTIRGRCGSRQRLPLIYVADTAHRRQAARRSGVLLQHNLLGTVARRHSQVQKPGGLRLLGQKNWSCTTRSCFCRACAMSWMCWCRRVVVRSRCAA